MATRLHMNTPMLRTRCGINIHHAVLYKVVHIDGEATDISEITIDCPIQGEVTAAVELSKGERQQQR